MHEYDFIVEATGFVRCLDTWEDGRRALTKRGFEPNELIAIFLGPGASYCMCEFVLRNASVYACELGWNDDHSEVLILQEWHNDNTVGNLGFARQLLTPEAWARLASDVDAWHERQLLGKQRDRETRQRPVRLFDIPTYGPWSNNKLDEPGNKDLIARLDNTKIMLLVEEVDAVPTTVFDELYESLKAQDQSSSAPSEHDGAG